MTYVKSTEHHHVFIDDDNRTHKVGISYGTKEEALTLLNTQSNNAKLTYKELREAEYIRQGLTPENFSLCLIQKELDGDTAMLNEYKAKRLAIKAMYPKK